MTHVQQAEAGRAPRRLTIYTVLVGAKEPLNDPLAALPAGASTDLDLDFVCLTDNRDLRSDVWRLEHLPASHLPPEKLSRRPKLLPHEYFAHTDHSLYIDNTVTLRRLPQASDLATSAPYLLRAFRHPDRSTLQDEADVVAMLGYDDVATICGQLDFYAACAPLDTLPPLSAATVLLRSHHHDTVRRFGVLWWENLLAFSKRDQLAMGFALRLAGAQVEHLPGALNDNGLVLWDDALGQRRVRANFDARRYAWLHRHDPQVAADPKAHFLAHGQGTATRYARRPPLLEYICARQGSSLGSQVSPRRATTDALQTLLAPQRGWRYLLVRVQGDAAAQAFSDGELQAASRSIAAYMGAGSNGTALDLDAAQLAAGDKVYAAPQQPFDLLVVLGLAPDQLVTAVHKLVRLLAPLQGALVAVLTGPAALDAVVRAERAVAEVLGAPVQMALHGSRHDGVQGMLHNTVLGLLCSGAPAAAADAVPSLAGATEAG